MEKFCDFFVTLRPSYLTTTLTYVLMEKVYPCFNKSGESYRFYICTCNKSYENKYNTFLCCLRINLKQWIKWNKIILRLRLDDKGRSYLESPWGKEGGGGVESDSPGGIYTQQLTLGEGIILQIDILYIINLFYIFLVYIWWYDNTYLYLWYKDNHYVI